MRTFTAAPFDLFRELTVAGLWCSALSYFEDAADLSDDECHQSAAAYDRTGRSLLAEAGARCNPPAEHPCPDHTGLSCALEGA